MCLSSWTQAMEKQKRTEKRKKENLCKDNLMQLACHYIKCGKEKTEDKYKCANKAANDLGFFGFPDVFGVPIDAGLDSQHDPKMTHK